VTFPGSFLSPSLSPSPSLPLRQSAAPSVLQAALSPFDLHKKRKEPFSQGYLFFITFFFSG
jgi:hypothetical protein